MCDPSKNVTRVPDKEYYTNHLQAHPLSLVPHVCINRCANWNVLTCERLHTHVNTFLGKEKKSYLRYLLYLCKYSFYYFLSKKDIWLFIIIKKHLFFIPKNTHTTSHTRIVFTEKNTNTTSINRSFPESFYLLGVQWLPEST